MDCTGKIRDISRDLTGQGILVTLFLSEASVKELQLLQGMDRLFISLKKWKKKRSLDANAYYWKLLTQLAEEVLNVSKPVTHNMMLRRYGQYEFIDGQTVRMPIPDTDSAEQAALEATTYHIKPTSQVKQGVDGTMYRTYVMLKGSSEYDTREMSRLIDGLVEEYGPQIRGQMSISDYADGKIIGQDLVNTDTGEIIGKVTDFRTKEA